MNTRSSSRCCQDFVFNSRSIEGKSNCCLQSIPSFSLHSLQFALGRRSFLGWPCFPHFFACVALSFLLAYIICNLVIKLKLFEESFQGSMSINHQSSGASNRRERMSKVFTLRIYTAYVQCMKQGEIWHLLQSLRTSKLLSQNYAKWRIPSPSL